MTEPTAPATTAAPATVAEPVRAALFGPGRRATTVGLVLLTLVTAFEAMGVGTAMPAVIADLGAVSAYGWPFSAFSPRPCWDGAGWALVRRRGPGPRCCHAAAVRAGLVVAGTAARWPNCWSGGCCRGRARGPSSWLSS
jgi:hypothetical protein